MSAPPPPFGDPVPPFAFNRIRGLLVVPVELQGPRSVLIVQMALHTGTTHTTINEGVLQALRLGPEQTGDPLEVATTTTVENRQRYVLPRIAALGHLRTNFVVLSHTLPPRAGVDGVLGLDFLRGQTLTVNFWDGLITLT